MRYLLMLVLILTACTAAPSQTGKPAAAMAASNRAVQATPSPYVAPTMDATLQARVTLASVELAEAQARNAKLAEQQAELDYQMTASAATATAWPATATQGAVLIGYALQTQVQKTAISNTQTPAFATAQIMQMRITREQTVGPVRAWGEVVVILTAGSLVCWLLWVVLRRRRLDVQLLENELAIQKMDIAQRQQTAPGDSFTIHGDHTLRVIQPIVPMGLTAEHVTAIARWVVEHEYIWTDDMRRGDGVGISHQLLVAYRDGYLVRAGVLVRVNDRYMVTETGKDYFRKKAGLEDPE